ncbi:hypothetical protein UFOVP1196_35 [uncultured Caudovirales phage]|uniref:Uncharacterized protein n=1 Tax=uncultured Caudovirales phage TaxID=2100421 RepID=A0A6J5R2I7_9CAUD|nr:hypothetical protein UFOVP1196_35 [uncultured Caudovirales phage]
MNTIEQRRSYVEGMILSSGLSEAAALLAMSAAMSAVDIEDDDDFEVMVEACLEGAAESEVSL